MTIVSGLSARAAKWFELGTGESRLLPMEGLRGLSALLVFFVHFDSLFGSRVEGTPVHVVSAFLGTLGNCGVDVFFVLSGFIIYSLLLKKPYGYFSFVRRRIRRVYPTFTAIFLMYLCLSVAVRSLSKVPHSLGAAAVYLGANYLMLPGIFPIVAIVAPAWSLSYELLFYLTMPLVVRWLRIFAWAPPLRAIFWLSICAGYLAWNGAGVAPYPRMVMFGCGVLLRETIQWRVGWERFGSAAALVSFLLALSWFGVANSVDPMRLGGLAFGNEAITLAGLFASTYALGYYVLSGSGFLARWFSQNWLRWFGNMSYSYYLTHGLVLHMIKEAVELLHLPLKLSGGAYLALGCAALIATIIGSAAVFLTVERRFLLPASKATIGLVPADAKSVPAEA